MSVYKFVDEFLATVVGEPREEDRLYVAELLSYVKSWDKAFKRAAATDKTVKKEGTAAAKAAAKAKAIIAKPSTVVTALEELLSIVTGGYQVCRSENDRPRLIAHSRTVVTKEQRPELVQRVSHALA